MFLVLAPISSSSPRFGSLLPQHGTPQSDRMSRLRSPFLHDPSTFVTVDLLTECAAVDAAEQEKRCRLTMGRVRWPPDENARMLIPLKVVSDSDLIPVAASEVKPVVFGAKRRWHSYGA
jgi:hypothetical protein